MSDEALMQHLQAEYDRKMHTASVLYFTHGPGAATAWLHAEPEPKDPAAFASQWYAAQTSKRSSETQAIADKHVQAMNDHGNTTTKAF